ncbi:MAG TPA: YggT family protein, partial [Candidatus Limnocylindria bacterium]
MTYPPNTTVDPATGEPVNVNAPVNTYGQPVAVTSSPLTPIRRAVWLIFGVIIVLIGIRILFLALGANEGNGIVDAIYAITEPFVAPFRGIFSFEQISPIGQSQFDVAALVAILGWFLVALLITAILR